MNNQNHDPLAHFRGASLALLLLFTIPLLVPAGGRQEEEEQRDPGTRIELGNETEEAAEPEPEEPADEPETTPAWILGQHELDDTLERTISGNIERGYVPVGLDMKTGVVTVLYLRTNQIEFTRWTIQEIEDVDNINPSITAALQDGWMPLDISLIPGGLAVLLVETDHDVDGWRLEVIPASNQALRDTYARYQADGFVPYGLAANPEEEQFWILFLRTEGLFELPAVVIDGYTDEEFAAGINQRYANGALPWAMTRLPGSYLVQYLQQPQP